ncbi:MAG: hypothetical protein KF873_21670 [Gemmataceae bacterium]|nr:hypothetical protein [Gemmataceae bacterium]
MRGTARNGLAGLLVVAAVAWLALPRAAVGQPGGTDHQTMKSRNLAFDLNVDAEQKNTIHSIELYVSRENGGVWELGATATPDAKSIPYVAKEDGLYLVNMVIVYKSGVRDPADVTKTAPLQKLLVDATAPVLTIKTAEKTGDDVRVAWSVDDRNPADAKTKLEWKPLGDLDSAWKTVPIANPDRRSATFAASASTGLTVRVTVEDLAGNTATQTKDIAGTTSTSFAPASVLPAPEMKLPTGEAGIVLPTLAPAPALPKTAGPPAPVLDLTKDAAKPFALPSITPPALSAIPPAASALSNTIASTSPPAPIASAELPAVTAVNYLKFDLPYQLEAGPSGISKIELYVTRDDGKSWNKWSVHDGEQRPLRVALDARGNVQPEGVYGLRLVPISGAGISEHPPAEGAAPDFRVLVDLTPPSIKMYAPDADAAQPGTLMLKWKIEDKNPAKDGVAVAWSETPAGPWKSIGSETGGAIVAGAGSDAPVRLADTGSFAWKLPERVPAKVYLRMTAWDAAGNKSEVTTPNPVLVDLTKPRARIQGILPAGGLQRP